MKTYAEILQFLESPIPRDEVAIRHEGGKTLSYLEAWRVIDLLNQCFGPMGWESETVERECAYSDTGKRVIYVTKVRIKAYANLGGDRVIQIIKEGTGAGESSTHEMAAKEAESDALKRAAMKFGKRLGLALYDKTQEFVTDGKEKTPQPGNPRPDEAKAESPVGGQVSQSDSGEAPKVSRELINKAISSYSRTIVDRRIKTQGDLVKLLEALGAKRKEELSDENAEKLLAQLKEICK